MESIKHRPGISDGICSITTNWRPSLESAVKCRPSCFIGSYKPRAMAP